MSVSFSLAMIMRNVEVRAASPAFIEAFIWSVNCVSQAHGGAPARNRPCTT